MSDEQSLENWKSNSVNLGKVYAKAWESLLLPVPSIHLDFSPSLNKLTRGVRQREFTILCGATGVGKTTLCSMIASDFLKKDIPQWIASVETGPIDFARRLIGIYAEKNINEINQVTIDSAKKFHTDYGHVFKYGKTHLSLYENRFSVEELIREIEYHVKTYGIKLAMIDNLNFFLEVTSARESVTEMDRVVHELIIFCKRIDCHILMVMHPKKTDHGRVESEFDIKGSSTSVQEAHNVWLFNRPLPQMVKDGQARSTDREIKIAKCRYYGKYIGSRILYSTPDGGMRYVDQGVYA